MSVAAILPIIDNGISLAREILKVANPDAAKKLEDARIDKIDVRSKIRVEIAKKPSDQNDGYVQDLLEQERVLDETIIVYMEAANAEVIKRFSNT